MSPYTGFRSAAPPQGEVSRVHSRAYNPEAIAPGGLLGVGGIGEQVDKWGARQRLMLVDPAGARYLDALDQQGYPVVAADYFDALTKGKMRGGNIWGRQALAVPLGMGLRYAMRAAPAAAGAAVGNVPGAIAGWALGTFLERQLMGTLMPEYAGGSVLLEDIVGPGILRGAERLGVRGAKKLLPRSTQERIGALFGRLRPRGGVGGVTEGVPESNLGGGWSGSLRSRPEQVPRIPERLSFREPPSVIYAGPGDERQFGLPYGPPRPRRAPLALPSSPGEIVYAGPGDERGVAWGRGPNLPLEAPPVSAAARAAVEVGTTPGRVVKTVSTPTPTIPPPISPRGEVVRPVRPKRTPVVRERGLTPPVSKTTPRKSASLGGERRVAERKLGQTKVYLGKQPVKLSELERVVGPKHAQTITKAVLPPSPKVKSTKVVTPPVEQTPKKRKPTSPPVKGPSTSTKRWVPAKVVTKGGGVVDVEVTLSDKEGFVIVRRRGGSGVTKEIPRSKFDALVDMAKSLKEGK